jgi:hypothetical protein
MFSHLQVISVLYNNLSSEPYVFILCGVSALFKCYE